MSLGGTAATLSPCPFLIALTLCPSTTTPPIGDLTLFLLTTLAYDYTLGTMLPNAEVATKHSKEIELAIEGTRQMQYSLGLRSVAVESHCRG